MDDQSRNDPELSCRIKSSVTSLKELIVILTGFAITSALFAFFRDVVAEQTVKSSTTAGQPPGLLINLTLHGAKELVLLGIFMLCVLRFYHGNIMILDRYYLDPPIGKTSPNRFLIADTLLIICMNILLTILGLSIQYPFVFFAAFFLTLLISVTWLLLQQGFRIAELLQQGFTIRQPTTLSQQWVGEWRSELIWLINNGAFALMLAICFGAFVQWNPAGGAPEGIEFGVTMNAFGFTAFCVLCIINSAIDFALNAAQYFPALHRTPKSARP